jgi:hypothetical protein
MELLHLPSARWTGKNWVDENELEYPSDGVRSLGRCPRRIGLVSQGLVVRGLPDTLQQLLSQRYACVIVDEAHRARRRELPKIDASDTELDERGEPNKLMKFLQDIGPRTKSMLLATATPVQLHPIEAWDLLHILSHGNDGVLGGRTRSSPWYQPSKCLAIATGRQTVPTEIHDGWQFVRDPMPARTEGPAFDRIRRSLDAPDNQWQFRPEVLSKLPPAIQRVQLANDVLPVFGEQFNPLLRCIIRRTRKYLEETINPSTGGYYLPKVEVQLLGEGSEDALALGGYLLEAYQEAEAFCNLLKQRVRGAGFFKTLLLRRLGSSMEAGRRTVSKLLGHDIDEFIEEEDDFGDDMSADAQSASTTLAESDFKNFTEGEVQTLTRCLQLLRQGGNRDPKLEAIMAYLLGEDRQTEYAWKDLGCILFSQYYDTVKWVGDELSKRSEFQDMMIGLYAGSNRSGYWLNGRFQRIARETLKAQVRAGELKLLLGTDAASEGLNLQRLGTLINIDLPWNPTRLEQRKGRIQRIGQTREVVYIANLRYRDSVEDRVHAVLAGRLQAIHDLFGQIPDTLEDVWVEVAMHNEQKARELIDRTTITRNPFDAKYSKVEDADWESCSLVLDPISVKELLKQSW